jgi:hypothetical protein
MLRLLVSLLGVPGGGAHHPAKLTVVEPCPYEVWDGHLQGRASRIVHLRAGGRRYTLVRGPSGRFSVRVAHFVIGDTAVTVAGRRIPVYGLPGAGSAAPPGRSRRCVA